MKLISEKKFRVDYLGISATGFWRLKKRGELPTPVVIGKRNYYMTQTIIEWLASKQNKAG